MGKKHGFRGTPVRPSGIPSSIGGIFEKRGDPMVSPREGREKYGRNLETENPDFDRYFAEDEARQRQAQVLKPKQIQKGNAFAKSLGSNYDPQRAAANIILKMNAGMRKSEQGEQRLRTEKKAHDDADPDNIRASVPGGSKEPSREKQTPINSSVRSYYDFSGKNPPKEIKKNGKIYRRK